MSVISFQVPPFIDPFLGKAMLLDTPRKGSIWKDLRGEIEKLVRRDGIKERALEVLPGVTELREDFIREAIETIYADVTEFYSWYLNPEDDRGIWIGERASQNRSLDGKLIPFKGEMPSGLREKVGAVVRDNLRAMKEVGEIPADSEDIITDNLTRYIVNWEKWYYDRRELEMMDNYLEQKSIYEDSYLDEVYGDLGNILDDGEFDGVSDIPFLFE